MYLSCYLSRFNDNPYNNLIYGNMNVTFHKVVEILKTNQYGVKGMLDRYPKPLRKVKSQKKYLHNNSNTLECSTKPTC